MKELFVRKWSHRGGIIGWRDPPAIREAIPGNANVANDFIASADKIQTRLPMLPSLLIKYGIKGFSPWADSTALGDTSFPKAAAYTDNLQDWICRPKD